MLQRIATHSCPQPASASPPRSHIKSRLFYHPWTSTSAFLFLYFPWSFQVENPSINCFLTICDTQNQSALSFLDSPALVPKQNHWPYICLVQSYLRLHAYAIANLDLISLSHYTSSMTRLPKHLNVRTSSNFLLSRLISTINCSRLFVEFITSDCCLFRLTLYLLYSSRKPSTSRCNFFSSPLSILCRLYI